MEKTTEPRYLAYAKVRCQKYGSGTTSLMVLKNISKTGARLNLLASTLNFHRGDIIRLEVDLEGIKRIRVVNAEVIWSRAGAMGVSFVPPEDVYNKLLGQ